MGDKENTRGLGASEAKGEKGARGYERKKEKKAGRRMGQKKRVAASGFAAANFPRY